MRCFPTAGSFCLFQLCSCGGDHTGNTGGQHVFKDKQPAQIERFAAVL